MEFAGQKFRPSARRDRELTRVLRDTRAKAQQFTPGSTTPLPPGWMYAYNNTGIDVAFGTALNWSYTNYAPPPRRERHVNVRCNAVLSPISPPGDTGSSGADRNYLACAITVEPIAAASIGVVAVSGLAVYKKRITDCTWLRPNGALYNLVGDIWGCARVVSLPTESSGGVFSDIDYTVVDLSQAYLVAPYKITGATWGVGPPPSITALISPDSSAPYAAAIRDKYGIAAWQTTDDRGMATWDGAQWIVTQPFCLN